MVTLINDISDKIESFDVKKYSYTRNFVDGDISLLSPYISRGVISTKQIFNRLKQKHKTFSEIAIGFLYFINNKKFIIHYAAFELSFLNYELILINHKVIDVSSDPSPFEIYKCWN